MSTDAAAGHMGPGWQAKLRELPWLLCRPDKRGLDAVGLGVARDFDFRRPAQKLGPLCDVKTALVPAPLPCSDCVGEASAREPAPCLLTDAIQS